MSWAITRMSLVIIADKNCFEEEYHNKNERITIWSTLGIQYFVSDLRQSGTGLQIPRYL